MLLLLPALFIVAVAFVWPIANFVNFGLGNSSIAVNNFGGAGQLWHVAFTTLKLGFWTTFITLLLGYPLAYYLVRSSSRYRNIVFFVVFVPLMFSVVVRTFGWIVLLGSEGLLNEFLLRLGISTAPIVWLYNFPATVVGLVHVFLPFMVLSIVTALSGIDLHVEEAASVLGANRWSILRYVTIPLSAQGVFGGCAIVFSLAMGAYVTPKLIGGGRVQVLATEIYGQMLEIGDWRSAALLGTLLTALTLATVGTYRLSMRRRVEAD